MGRGITLADFVQQTYFAMYKARLEMDGLYHCHGEKFKEALMELNYVLREFQKEQDWNFYRQTITVGETERTNLNKPQRFKLEELGDPDDPDRQLNDDIYKVCTGYSDCLRLLSAGGNIIQRIPWVSPRSALAEEVMMFDQYGGSNVIDNSLKAMVLNNKGEDYITFNRPFTYHEDKLIAEIDVIRYIEPVHICTSDCPPECPLAYEQRWLREIPDEQYLVLRTAARLAAGDPSLASRQQLMAQDAQKLLSAMRENDSAHTDTDSYQTAILGYIGVM